MNLDMFDNMNEFILRERENSLNSSFAKNHNNNIPETSRFPAATPLAMAYVPFQQWGDVYDDNSALCKGTLFPELDLPFSKGGDLR